MRSTRQRELGPSVVDLSQPLPVSKQIPKIKLLDLLDDENSRGRGNDENIILIEIEIILTEN